MQPAMFLHVIYARQKFIHANAHKTAIISYVVRILRETRAPALSHLAFVVCFAFTSRAQTLISVFILILWLTTLIIRRSKRPSCFIGSDICKPVSNGSEMHNFPKTNVQNKRKQLQRIKISTPISNSDYFPAVNSLYFVLSMAIKHTNYPILIDFRKFSIAFNPKSDDKHDDGGSFDSATENDTIRSIRKCNGHVYCHSKCDSFDSAAAMNSHCNEYAI